jgi:hypothetical protein
MTYDHMVKVNGKWFGVGDEVLTSLPASVSVEKPVEPKTETKKVEEVKKPTTAKRSNNKGSKK